jgi:hypothetical protein
MKKTLSLLAILIITLPAIAQYKIQKVSNNTNTALEGMYYSLPQTVIRLDITMERIDQIPGPLSGYSEDFLGSTNYIKNENSIFNLVDVDILSFAEVDPNQVYYLEFPVPKSKEVIRHDFQLSNIGTLISYNATEEMKISLPNSTNINQTNLYYQGEESFNYFANYNRKKVMDTVVRKITIDTVTIDRFMFRTNWVNLSEKDKANEAALKIQNIREQRFNLLTGYQEVNYSGSIEYMDFQLRKMENDYLKLFLGKEVRSVETYTIYVVLKKGEKTRTILDAGNGNTVELQITSQGNTSLLPEKPLQKEDHLYYRIPENVIVNVMFNNKVQKSTNLLISQMGKLSMVSLNHTQLYFDPKTGNLIRNVKF